MGDSGGLHPLVTPSGGRLWRFKFRLHGVEKKLALGRYPDVSLSEARKARDAAREAVGAGNDPAAARGRNRMGAKVAAGTTFGDVAREYIDKAEREGRSPSTIAKLRWVLASSPRRRRVPNHPAGLVRGRTPVVNEDNREQCGSWKQRLDG